MRCLRGFLAREDGATAVEFAVVSLVFVFLCTGLVDFGRNIDAQARLGHAADAAARVIFLDNSATEAQVAARIAAGFPALGLSRVTLRLASQTIGARSFRRVTVSEPLRFLTPGFTGRGGTVTVQRLVPLG